MVHSVRVSRGKAASMDAPDSERPWPSAAALLVGPRLGAGGRPRGQSLRRTRRHDHPAGRLDGRPRDTQPLRRTDRYGERDLRSQLRLPHPVRSRDPDAQAGARDGAGATRPTARRGRSRCAAASPGRTGARSRRPTWSLPTTTSSTTTWGRLLAIRRSSSRSSPSAPTPCGSSARVQRRTCSGSRVPILPAHIWSKVDPKAAANTYPNKPPVIGTGPFQVVEYQPEQVHSSRGQQALLARRSQCR